ncbi:hypothetical protein OIU76_027162 [Salix suchowensis]|nr:hypothetical protein OIU76_027162 [Salix suchowensis]
MTWLNITSPLITFVKLSLPQVENLPKDAEATTDVIFSIFTAAALSCVKPASAVDDRSKPEDFTFPPKWVTFPTNVTLRLFEVLRIFDQSLDPNVVSDFFRLQEGMRGCDMIAVRSCMEFDPEWLHLLEEIHGKPVIPVGVFATTYRI